MTEDNENEEKSKQSKVSFFPIQSVESDNWAGAIREFFKQLGAVSSLLIIDRKSTRLNSSHVSESRMPSSA